MGKLLATLFLVVPAVELVGLIVLGGYIGFWATLAYVIVTAMLGGWLVRRAGLRVMRTFSEVMARGQVPDKRVMSGLLLLVAGVLIAIPGPVSDLLGVLLLLPPTRLLVAGPLQRYAMRRLERAGGVRVDFGGGPLGGDPFGTGPGHDDFDADDDAPPPPPSRGRIIDI